ncbi:CAP domain-containing protein [Nostoc sp.]|uniref:CAP domain-containing protein n=1 Tax=Nostoc sp. TaxID=1180 RepID=UPI002FF5A34A
MSTTLASFVSGQSYTVQPGDFLSAIAQKFYGDGSEAFWRKIYEVNKAVIGTDPSRIEVGMVLVIPPKDSSGVPPSPNNDVANRMLELVNQQRSEAGLAALRLNSQLTNAAQGHSQDMADHNFMAHNGSDGSSPFDRIKRAGYGYSFAGENVAAGQSTPEDAMSIWMNETPPNDGHRQNILSPNYHEIGIGYAFSDGTQFKHYWTQDFGTHQ